MVEARERRSAGDGISNSPRDQPEYLDSHLGNLRASRRAFCCRRPLPAWAGRQACERARTLPQANAPQDIQQMS
eukprot:409155-Pyramimonas_sp.AAC.1